MLEDQFAEDHSARGRFSGASYRNGAGNASLVAGIVAALASLVPFIGGVITICAAVIALVCGWIGLRRVDLRVATNPRDCVIGIGLGLAALFVAFLIFAATHGAT